ncbi:hypothetical protein PG984_010345, partial [Apiospora sp. TS-2023a]
YANLRKNFLLREGPKSPTFQVLHRLDNDTTCYLAQPSWRVKGTHTYLRGNVPLRDPEQFLNGLGTVAFVVYMVYSPSSAVDEGRKEAARTGTTEIPNPKPNSHFIRLHSTPMKESVEEFFHKLKAHNPDYPVPASGADLHSPFLFWYHYRSTGIVEGLDPSQHQSIKLLTNWIEETYGDKYQQVDELLGRGLITQDTVDFLFHPGQLIVRNSDTGPRGYKAASWLTKTSASGGDSNAIDGLEKSTYNLNVWYYNYNGGFWKGTEDLSFSICTSENQPEIQIDTLSVFPLRFANTELGSRLERRGETFWKCRRRRYVSYTSKNEDKVLSNDESVGFVAKYGEAQAASRYMAKEAMNEDHPPLGHEILFPNTIPGFSLHRKKWQDIEVDRIQDVKWYKEAFDHLVINEDTKELIHALITNRIESEKNTDWITTKGNGLIILLHGGPGTGKTFTAESLAELAEKPLYPITCGDIGTKPEDVERYLESALHLGNIWDCVVLLDEADVFLEQRTLNDLKRNALVSVFLRVLEYYEGILILTTNRVGIFDEAFKSRIQLALRYDNLEKPQRVQIWKNFFKRLQDLEGEDGSIDLDTLEYSVDELAEYPMNGRQIRNTITTARQLAKFKKRPMSLAHLQHVIKVAGKFDQYLLEVHDTISDDQIARGEGIR